MLSGIITEVKGILAAVNGAGKVNAYRRAVSADVDLLAAYKDDATGMIRGWDITRESTASEDHTVGATQELHTIVMRGFMSVNDANASEKTFQDLIESVRAAFRAKRNLNGSAIDSTPMQARTVSAATIGGVLVHYCELTIVAQEFPLSTS